MHVDTAYGTLYAHVLKFLLDWFESAGFIVSMHKLLVICPIDDTNTCTIYVPKIVSLTSYPIIYSTWLNIPSNQGLQELASESMPMWDLIHQVTYLYRLATIYSRLRSSKKKEWKNELFGNTVLDIILGMCLFHLCIAKGVYVHLQAFMKCQNLGAPALPTLIILSISLVLVSLFAA